MSSSLRESPVSSSLRERVALVVAFLDAALRYWLTVFPRATREIGRWQQRAARIPDPTLRGLGIDSLRERSNIEGAAAFAAFAPRAHRAAVVRALVAFQAAYNYADLLSEQPHGGGSSEQPHERAIANGRRLHETLLDALQTTPDPDRPRLDYYALHPQSDDGGYLRELVETTRAALSTQPSFPAVAASARTAAARIVVFQSLNVGTEQGDHVALAEWSRKHTPPGTGLQWWEVAAAAGSSLGVHVLIAAAAEDRLPAWEVAALERAYFPWIGALHSLLDNLVDRKEDVRTDQPSLVSYYASPAHTAARMRMLAVESVSRARALPRGRRHLLILAAMAGNYLSNPEANTPEVGDLAHSVLDAIGDLAGPTLLVFRLRRLGDGDGDGDGESV